MDKKEHAIVICSFIAVTLLFLFSMYENMPTGNSVLTVDKLKLINCVEKEENAVCDVQYPNSEINEEGYKKKI